MRVVLLPGIWPPDVGGPATHGPDFARYLVDRGHDVRVVTMADGEPSERPCPVETVPRWGGFAVRYPRLTVAASRAARRSDVVYATATYGAAAAAAVAVRRPLLAKLVSDPAYERARRYGLFRGSLEDFQDDRGGVARGLKRARTQALRVAAIIVVPSEYLARMARGWGIDASGIRVLPNAAPPTTGDETRPEPGLFVFAGRLTRQKALGTALAALSLVPDATLVIAGDGPDRAALEARARAEGLNGRVHFLGAVPRERVLELLRSAYAAVLPSDWENFPHAAVEALAVGTPVVATTVGGVPEIVRDGSNGLLVPPSSPEELAAALRRLLHDAKLRARLASAARASVEPLERGRIYGELEAMLASVVRR